MPSPDRIPTNEDLQLALGRVREAVGEIERGPELGDPDRIGRDLIAATMGLSEALIELMLVPPPKAGIDTRPPHGDRKRPRRYDAADG
jgi:hypothetical protein